VSRLPRIARVAAALLLPAVLAGCGYALVGKGGSFPQGVAKVAVAAFKNRTARMGLESQISTALVQRIMSTGKVKVSTLDEADARFEGAITGYASDAIAYTAQRVITQRRVTVTATVEFRVKGEATPSYTEEGITGKAEFDVTGSLTRDSEAEKAATVKALADLADKAVSAVVEGF
jgi:hypothetical protein